LTDEDVSIGLVMEVGEVEGDIVGAIVGDEVLVAKGTKVCVGVTVTIPCEDTVS
jgi:hypothetical protein